MVHHIGKENSIVNQFMLELRDVEIQSDRLRFRKNLERLGQIFAYEISKILPYKSVDVETSLGTANVNVPKEQPILATILRAGLPLHQGLLHFFDQADSAYISAYRKLKKSGAFDIQMEYVSSPDMESRIVIISDPMLATGRSMVLTCKELMARFSISEMHIVTVIASAEGIEYVKAHLPKAEIWVAAIDEEMTTKAYIVPGLGDAGDLAFGEKV